MSTYADWQHLERAMRAGVVCDALPARARVWMAVQLMEAEGVEAIGPSAIAKRCGLPLRTTNNHLKTLRAESVLKSNGGNYESAENRHAENRHAENRHDASAENRHSVPKTGTADGVPKTGTMAVPKTGTRTIYKKSRTTTTAVAPASPESKASSWPTFDSSNSNPEGLGDVVKAWESMTAPNGVAFVTQLTSATLSSLRLITEELSAARVLEAIDSIQAYVNDRGYHRQPPTHWIRERAAKIKAGASRQASKARGVYGGCDDLIGTTTDEEMAEARKLISPEESAELARIRAEGRKRAIAHIAKLKAQGLMK